MTFNEIKNELATAGKSVSDVQLYRYMRACEIQPVGQKTIPRNYPANSGRLIREWLGLPVITVAAPLDTAAGRLAGLGRLKSEKRNGKAKR